MNDSIVLSLIVAMACLASCAAPGEDNNYKMLDDEPADVHEGPYGQGEPKQMAEELASSLADEHRGDVAGYVAGKEDPVTVAVRPASDPSAAKEPAPAATLPAPAPAAGIASRPGVGEAERGSPVHATTEPSLNGLRRSHWPKITVGPADGTTHHYPIYFRDLRIHRRAAALSETNGVEALDGASAGNYDGKNAAALVLQPFKVAADLGLLIPRAVLRHPLRHATTP